MSSGGGSTEKSRLRAAILARRDALAPEWRARADGVITDRLTAIADARDARHVLSYSSFGSEWRTRPFNDWVLRVGHALYLPRIDRQSRRLVIHRVDDLDGLRPGVWQIPEPDPSICPVVSDPGVIDLALIPGLAFDASGGRLGYGGGFYDRLLVQVPQAFRIAAAYDFQIVPAVPMESHDQRVSCIVTESQVSSVSAG